LKVLLTANNHPSEFEGFFPIAGRDAFHESAVLNALWPKWYSILINDGAMAFHNSFAPSPIIGTAAFDVEPFMGYAGPLINTGDQKFIRAALEIYSNKCRELNIIAELIRFDPLLGNQAAFFQQESVQVSVAKDVVVVACCAEEDKLLSHFSEACRRRVRLGLRSRRFARLESGEELFQFRALYESSVKRRNMGRHWLFSENLYRHASNSELFAMYGVYDNDRLVAAALVLHHPTCSHYALVANAPDYPPGASELLVFGIAQESAKRGTSRLMLGGGITSAPDDSLLRFKQKFAAETSAFYIGKLIHDRTRYFQLCNKAVVADPGLAASPFFLKYRCRAESEQSGVQRS
jgi:hypothetical protein